MFVLQIKKDCDVGDLSKSHINNFIKLACKFLKINKEFTVKLIGERESENHTTAYYRPDNCLIVVKINKRALVDILRSIAHELTHHKQFQNNELTNDVQDIGGFIEDEANSLAGQLIKIYAKLLDNKDIYDLSINESIRKGQLLVEDGYSSAIADKNKIDSIISDINKELEKWYKNNFKDTDNIVYNKNTYPNSSDNRIKIKLDKHQLDILFRDKGAYYYYYFDKENNRHKLESKAKFNKNGLIYDKESIYHELQHMMDNILKFKEKKDNIWANYKDDKIHGDEAYYSQAIEFNPYFTSYIMTEKDKFKQNYGIKYNNFFEFISYILKQRKDFSKYFNKITLEMKKKYLKRAYKYYNEFIQELSQEVGK